MKYKAKVNFCGVVNMAAGEVKEIADAAIAKDLLRAGYIEEDKASPISPKVSKTKRVKK